LSAGAPPSIVLRVISIVVSAPAAGRFTRSGEPVRLGLPIAAGRAIATDRLALFDASGRAQLLQACVLDRWPGGSIRWLLLDFLADHDGSDDDAVYTLDLDAASVQRPADRTVAVHEERQVLSVVTGPLRIDVERSGAAWFRQVQAFGAPVIEPERTRLNIETAEGPVLVAIDRAQIEAPGPVRAILRLEGTGRVNQRRLNLTVRLHAFAGSPAVRVDVTLHNPDAAAHPGNFWELGEAKSVLIRDAALHLAWPADAGEPRFSCSLAPGESVVPCGSAFELWQASSGGDHWASRNHVDRDGNVPLAFKGYRLTGDGCAVAGNRATPLVAGQRGASILSMAVPQFWQNFPKAIAGSRDGLTLHLFPRQHAAGHELQPGEQKTHQAYVAFAATALDWARVPLFVRATPEHYATSGAFPYLLPIAEEPSAAYAALVQAGVEAPDGFEQKRELIDEYGWRHFGDLYADHEQVYYKGPPPVHSHYNNQYDALAGMARQFARSGEIRWWRQFCELAAHVIDIDVYRTEGDKSAYSHGLFWHTSHYIDAGRSTHRSYPRAESVSGGGPSSEHNYTTGLLLYHFLTGEPAGRDTALMLARWVVDMDDGTKTVFRWLSRAPTGLASATYEPGYHGPGRGAGHSIAALMDGYHLSGDAAFLHKAEVLIRRCVHPADDIGARQLLDIERRWSYTIFLHVLGRYLDEKLARGQVDGMYAYARQSLLVYAEWMRTHEQPYFERRDQLEYPTETWVAQELWKSEVFTYAAKYADDSGMRTRFAERADFFFDYAIETLRRSPTRTLTRPQVLLLSRGLMHGYVARRPDALAAPMPPPVTPGPLPPAFVPQKARAIRRGSMLAAALAAVLAAGAVAAGLLLLR
jgi:hypothetical protein